MNKGGTPENLKPFPKGVSGNPKGRPKSARSKLSESFIKALADDFKSNGIEAIKRVREEKPEQYLAAVGKLVPKEMDVDVSGSIIIPQTIALVAPKTDDDSPD